jgi:hypothetical protein
MAKQHLPVKIGTRVRLKSFLGARQASPDRQDDSQNNYWLLIGQQGLVVKEDPYDPEHVLVKFEVDVISFGLHCHNEIPNSLWIRLDDLQNQAGSVGE